MGRAFWVSVIVAVILIVGGMALLGLPGAIYALVTAPVAEALRGLPQGSLIEGDRAWPMAIWMTMVVPPALPLAVWLRQWLRPEAGWLEATGWVAIGVYLWALAFMLAQTF
ncbi:hypothetical protein [Devosia sediminis]|uniref:Uncharacterized protein n=1 Tax=Devosia sediminis TaxID=2798801 RepID=A0A934MH73_9HYPH|nr:hypothetical protein [Devosia sediminis]MBJ3784757.1 hypothetical protein [Devosia sediminis]